MDDPRIARLIRFGGGGFEVGSLTAVAARA
jgi:hypothetical protein